MNRIETLFNTADRKRFYCPSRLVWGAGCHAMAGELAGEAGSIMLFVDRFFADHPLISRLREDFGPRLVATHVCANMPRTQDLLAIADATTSPPDVVVSIGGGSTADAAKAVIARWIFGTFDGVGMGDKRGLAPRPGAARPLLIGMPTTAGTGADLSRYYVTYDSQTRAKVHGKSFELLADWVLIDPVLLRESPADLMVISAFDAFIHFFESFVCRGERSWFGDILSLDGMTRILSALEAYLAGERGDETLLSLNYAAALGGVAITNIRTGNIHEAAGALLERTPLTHGETLMVFLEPAYRQYRNAIAEREALLLRHLGAHAPHLAFRDVGAIIDWWRAAFARFGLDRRIAAAMEGVADRGEARAHILDRVVKDRVWCEKESPVPLTDADVAAFVDASLAPYWA